MEFVYKGKTKDVYKSDDGNYVLKFKNDATGKDGVFDPGENEVGLSIDGLGKTCLSLSKYYFLKAEKNNIPTHYIGVDEENTSMIVKEAKTFGNGLEMIYRFKAVGSFFKRYGTYIKEGTDLDGFFEITIKDDKRKDPVISKKALEVLKIMTSEEYQVCKRLTKKSAKMLKDDLSEKELQLYDVKFEFGKSKTGEIILIDEISAGNMRVYKNNKWLQPMELAKIILKDS